MRAVEKRDILMESLEEEGSWAVSYGDMVTLLLCFFILFFTTNPQRDESLRLDKAVLNILQATGSLTKASAEKNPSKVDDKSNLPHATVNIGNLQQEGADQEVLQKWNGVAQKIGQEIVIAFPYVSFFKSGETDLTLQGAKALKEFAQVYMPYAGRFKVKVQAYTDIKTVRARNHSRFRNNLELSALRSISAMTLLNNLGIPMNQIRIAGFGEIQLTKEQINGMPEELRKPSSELDYARKVVLSIQVEGAQPK